MTNFLRYASYITAYVSKQTVGSKKCFTNRAHDFFHKHCIYSRCANFVMHINIRGKHNSFSMHLCPFLRIYTQLMLLRCF